MMEGKSFEELYAPPVSATDNPVIYVTRNALPISLLYFDRGQNRPFMEKEDNGHRIVTLKSNMRVSMEHTRNMMRFNNQLNT